MDRPAPPLAREASYLRLDPCAGRGLREQWSAILTSSYYPAEAARLERENFYGEVSQCTIGDMQVSRMRCGRHVLRRTARHIALQHDNSLIFAMPVVGSFTYEQLGRTGTVGRQQALIFDTNEPYSYEVSRAYENICFRIDRNAFATRLPDLEDVCGRPLTLDQTSAWFLRTTLSRMLEEAMTSDRRSREVLAGNIAGYVLDLALEATLHSYLAPTGGSGERYRHTQLRRITGYIMRNLDDPDLTPDSVAEANGISTSYLYKLFKPTGLSVGKWITHRRLELCRARLSDPQYQDQSITQIAFDLGFNNLSHFSTRFRQAFACSPRELRRSLDAG